MAVFPFPMPSGWFGLCYAHELAPGEVKKVRLAGRDLAVFRTESGEVAALNNYCTHLGAPLHQGVVVGETVRCPFHHWQWNGQGECTAIPYAKKIPEKARIDAIPVVEINGMIMGWHHPKNEPPHYEVQYIEALNGEREGWGDIHYQEFTLPTCVQEIAENDVDNAHFPYLHNTQGMHETEATFDGPIKTSVSTFKHVLEHLKGDADPDSQYALSRYSHGPGSVTVHATGVEGGEPGVVGEFVLYHVATPIEDDQTKVRWSMVLSTSIETDDAGQSILAYMSQGVYEDIPIWEEKIYQPNPVLCDGDGPISKNRKWFEQFYIS
jgi:phenylpropionate dioxygenase-like ring-hydroxylating dioxygenase large terminal subunit